MQRRLPLIARSEVSSGALFPKVSYLCFCDPLLVLTGGLWGRGRHVHSGDYEIHVTIAIPENFKKQVVANCRTSTLCEG